MNQSHSKTLLITQDFPPTIGGISAYYENLADKMDPENIVVLMNKCSGYQNISKPHKLIYKNFYIKYIWPHWLPLIWHIFKVVKQQKISNLWVGQVLPVGTAVYFLTRLINRPYIVTCHGNDLLRAKKKKRKFKLAKNILTTANSIQVNTEFTKNILIQDFLITANKIQVVYPTCTLSKQNIDQTKVEQLKKQFHLENKKVLLTVNRLVESKGVDTLISIMPELTKHIPNLAYLIVGDGPDKNRLEKLTSGQSNIIFVGAIAHNNLPNYYALADVFALTPKPNNQGDTESFGIVYLEALEFGLPVVAGRTGGAAEIKQYFDKNNQFNLVDVGDKKQIFEILLKLLK